MTGSTSDDWLTNAADEIQFTTDMAMVLFHNSPDAIVVVDSEGRIRMANVQSELLFGYHRSELHGQQVEMLIPEALRARHEHNRQSFVDDPRVRPMGVDLDLLALRKDGTEVGVAINLSPAVTARGMFIIATVRRKRGLGPGELRPTNPAHTVS